MPEIYYSDEHVTLYHGDCIDVMRAMPDASVDAIVTDPSVTREAVEAAASAVRKERAFSAAAAFGVPMYDVPQCAEMIARAALTAALPLLTAAPSVTREEVAEALGVVWDDGNGSGLDGWVGPGRGAGEVDHEAVRARDRAVDRALRVIAAAPSATREATEDEVTEVVTEALTDAYWAERGMSRHTGLTAHDESVIRDQAAHVVSLADARFTITPKEDR